MENLRIVLLGKTGSGKSSFANMMFNDAVFPINHTANPGTRRCHEATREAIETKITLIDTPGFFDNRMSDDDLKSEITECITMCSDGLHAFLIFLKVDKFTDQEKEVITQIKECFSEQALKYAMVVFTHGDQLEEGKEIEDFIKENPDLCDLLRRCGGRCCVVDNKYWKNNPQDEYRNNQKQVEKLLNNIKEMVEKNNPSCYTNPVLQAVNGSIQEEEACLKSLLGDVSPEEIRYQAKRNVSKILQEALGISIGVLLGALLGVPVAIAKVLSALTKMKDSAVVKTVATVGTAASAATATQVTEAVVSSVGVCVAVGASVAIGAVVGGCIGYDEAGKANSVGEAAKNTAKAVIGTAAQSFKEVQDNFLKKEEENVPYKKLQ